MHKNPLTKYAKRFIIIVEVITMKKFIEKFCNIRNVMALILTLTFAALAIMRVVSATEFMTVLTAVVVYFFVDNIGNGKGGKKNE
jgi:hypothetical protein